MKRIDLTNQVFGKLTVLEQAESFVQPSGKKSSAWWCECECGNRVRVRTDGLRSGKTTSCGCNAGRVDITGQRYGRLTVIRYNESGEWLCQCDCGNIASVRTYNLKNGNTKSCGCLQRERSSESSLISLVGNRYGKLTVTERAENNRFGHVCYKCKCDCGGEVIVDSTNLRNGNTNSCGCIKSKGEMKIQQYFQNNNIKYQAQYSFDDIILSSGRRPFYDFVVFDEENKIKCVIEYHGKQHYFYSGYGWDTKENFLKTQQRDEEKRKALIKKQIKLYEIPYSEIDNLEEILNKIIKM